MEVLEAVAEVVALAGRVLEQDHRLAAAARLKKLRDAGGDARQAFGLVGRARMHDEPEQAEAFRPIELLAERGERLLAQHRVRRREVRQIAGVRDDGLQARTGDGVAKLRDFAVVQHARLPLADRFREDLQRLAAGGFGAFDRFGNAAGNRQVSSEKKA